MSAPIRPRFEPKTDFEGPNLPPLSSIEHPWTSLLYCNAGFPKDLFQIAVAQLVEHPEYNSTLILRSEQLSDTTDNFPDEIPLLEGHVPLRCIHRRLLPRRPGRDEPLVQYCTLYAREDDDLPTVLVLTPLGSPLPYYHPAVSHIGFRYLDSDPPTLQLDVLPLPATPSDVNSRLFRTSLALLDTLHRYGWGAMTNYKKRVQHDNLVPREVYQDKYLQMREKYKHLVNSWQETTDPLKHVFEDIGIATYLILLWQLSYRDRPPNGFLDFGCGNGLLTHILISEGYHGCGIDLRARISWSHYSKETHEHLHVHAFNPFSETPDPYLLPGVFIIGNHADELTPWVPVLATMHSASGYISIPCCPWTFDAKFDRSLSARFPLADGEDEASFIESLSLGGHSSPSSAYSMYRVWLASLSRHCGWQIECETLRIPSTRNWAIVGRKRSGDADAQQRNIDDIIQFVRDRGIFKSRKPEGKAGDH
ncbi:DUF1613 domain-containing protein [Mucidula mucida]|nr:DUF1613 domain-containing protein [Mucidula mucida]